MYVKWRIGSTFYFCTGGPWFDSHKGCHFSGSPNLPSFWQQTSKLILANLGRLGSSQFILYTLEAVFYRPTIPQYPIFRIIPSTCYISSLLKDFYPYFYPYFYPNHVWNGGDSNPRYIGFLLPMELFIFKHKVTKSNCFEHWKRKDLDYI